MGSRLQPGVSQPQPPLPQRLFAEPKTVHESIDGRALPLPLEMQPPWAGMEWWLLQGNLDYKKLRPPLDRHTTLGTVL